MAYHIALIQSHLFLKLTIDGYWFSWRCIKFNNIAIFEGPEIVNHVGGSCIGLCGRLNAIKEKSVGCIVVGIVVGHVATIEAGDVGI